MQDQHTAAPPDGDRTQPIFERRRGPRRADETDVPNERRGEDRRKKKPGLSGLLSAIFGHGKNDPEAPEG